jgi:hypothetical protein
MSCWNRQGPGFPSVALAIFSSLTAALVLGFLAADAFGASSQASGARPEQRTPIYQFLVSNGVPITSPIRVAKVSAVIRTRQKVRSVVKLVGPDKLPDPEEIAEIRKAIEKKKRQGVPVRFNLSKRTSELDLLRHYVLTGEVAEFRPQEKLGDLELYFSENQSLKIEIGNDLFLIIVGKNYCAFRSPDLRRQLDNILETRKAESGGKHTNRSGGGRPPR